MNYYLLQSHYILLFIVITTLTFSAIPFIDTAFSDFSDSYVKSEMRTIQGEMFFYKQGRGSFTHSCESGKIGLIIQDIIKEHGSYVSCRINKPLDSKMIVCAQLRSSSYNCVDSLGTMCEITHEPNDEFDCKRLVKK